MKRGSTLSTKRQRNVRTVNNDLLSVILTTYTNHSRLIIAQRNLSQCERTPCDNSMDTYFNQKLIVKTLNDMEVVLEFGVPRTQRSRHFTLPYTDDSPDVYYVLFVRHFTGRNSVFHMIRDTVVVIISTKYTIRLGRWQNTQLKFRDGEIVL